MKQDMGSPTPSERATALEKISAAVEDLAWFVELPVRAGIELTPTDVGAQHSLGRLRALVADDT